MSDDAHNDQAEQLARMARAAAQDALHVSVGLGILAIQEFNVRRRELVERVPAAALAQQRIGAVLHDRLDVLEHRLDVLERQLDPLLDQAQQRLPSPAGDAVRQARDAARVARRQLHDLAHHS